MFTPGTKFFHKRLYGLLPIRNILMMIEPFVNREQISPSKCQNYCQNYATYSGGSRIFPGGAPTPGGGRDTILLNFPKNCMKSRKIWSLGGGAPPP